MTYEEVLKNNNLKNDEVIYFGNSEKEDYIPAKEHIPSGNLEYDINDNFN